jgi:uncharacterized caspase-like protein
MAGENRLLTAGFDAMSHEAIERESVSLDAVRAAFAAAKPKLGLIVLDACRNNPLAESRLAAQGLARAQGGAGLLIAYATDPGNVAYDGLGATASSPRRCSRRWRRSPASSDNRGLPTRGFSCTRSQLPPDRRQRHR